MNVLTGFPGLHEPPRVFTPDPARNRESARRIAALEPALVGLGHGAPVRDTAKFVRFVEGPGSPRAAETRLLPLPAQSA
jgi:hypothetical protein